MIFQSNSIMFFYKMVAIVHRFTVEKVEAGRRVSLQSNPVRQSVSVIKTFALFITVSLPLPLHSTVSANFPHSYYYSFDVALAM